MIFQSTLPMQGATRRSWQMTSRRSFQSTLPMQGATAFPRASRQLRAHFNPRSPCRERLFSPYSSTASLAFQSTLPMQGATGDSFGGTYIELFQSTLPMQGATRARSHTRSSTRNFNPRSPCRERPRPCSWAGGTSAFQSTLPMQGATNERDTRIPYRLDFNPRSPCRERLSSSG